jgi:copper transport protein
MQRGARFSENFLHLPTWLVVALLCLLFPLTPAFAHSALIASVPADGAIVQTAPRQFSLTFNEQVAPLVLKLVRPDGSSSPLDHYALKDATLVIDAPELAEGAHVLVWRIVSADGHPVGGSLVFSVGAPSAGGPPEAVTRVDRPVRAALWLSKVALYAGLFFGVGGAFFLAWIGSVSGRAKVFTRGLLRLGLVAALLSVGLQGLDALDLPLMALAKPAVWDAGFGTSYGSTATAALLALLAAMVSIGLPWKAARRPLALLALAGVGFALAASGHAADAAPHWLTRPAVFLHAVGIACWAGALMPLAFVLSAGGPDATAALRRFSRLIPYPIVAMAVAGITLAVIQVQSVGALVATSYGRVLIAKLVIVAMLFALAMRNRWRLTEPAASGDATTAAALVRSIRLEIILVCVVFAVAALWRFTPPPRVLAMEAALPASVHIHAEKAMADISVAPGHAGPVAVSIFIMDGAFDPLPAKELTLVLSNAAAGIEPIKRPAKRVDGIWRVDDLVLPLGGRWTVRLDILVSDFEMVKLESEIAIRH